VSLNKTGISNVTVNFQENYLAIAKVFFASSKNCHLQNCRHVIACVLSVTKKVEKRKKMRF